MSAIEAVDGSSTVRECRGGGAIILLEICAAHKSLRGTTLPFKPGRMNGSLPSISANQASGCFVCFREVDHSMPVADMGAILPVKQYGERPLSGIAQ